MRKQRNQWLDLLLLANARLVGDCEKHRHADNSQLNLADVDGSQTTLIFERNFNCSKSGAASAVIHACSFKAEIRSDGNRSPAGKFRRS